MSTPLEFRNCFRKPRFEVLEPRLPLSGDPILLDPNETDWAFVPQLTISQFADDFNDRISDNILIDIEVNKVNGQPLISSIWQQNLDARNSANHINLTSSQFNEKSVQYGNNGFRLIDQESYLVRGQQYYAATWLENLEEHEWAAHYNLTSADFSNRLNQYHAEYILTDMEAYPVGISTRYSGSWIANEHNLQWFLHRDRTSTEFANDVSAYEHLYRIHDIESYQVNGQQRYAAIWVENPDNRGWAAVQDMDAQEYFNNRIRYQDLGYRLTDYEQYETNAGTRYAGVWRQNTNRSDWYLRSDISALAEDHLAEHNIPGMSVAVVYQGEIQYMQGFGKQNVADDIWYSAHTINRLASISKAVAGVLLLKLADQGEIDPSATTANYISELPEHHTHTLKQLTSNRGGVGHYSQLGLGTLYTQYDTALTAAELFWDKPLVFTPETNYYYSTHGYTLLGAGIEGATNLPIDEVLENTLGSGLELPTLKAEDRSVANAFRTTLYNTNNTVATADNISWKILGGGIEASAYDLARFASMLMGGQILSPDSLEQLWTVPAPTNVSYALGWSVGTHAGEFSIRKDGSQLGANTYLRLFPEIELGIVVLSNRRYSEPGNLSSEIANTIIPTLPTIQGDFNSDAIVDAADYTVLQDTFGSTTDLRADADGNGVIGQDDYQLWHAHFGTILTSKTLAAVQSETTDLQQPDIGQTTRETPVRNFDSPIVVSLAGASKLPTKAGDPVSWNTPSSTTIGDAAEQRHLLDHLFAQLPNPIVEDNHLFIRVHPRVDSKQVESKRAEILAEAFATYTTTLDV